MQVYLQYLQNVSGTKWSSDPFFQGVCTAQLMFSDAKIGGRQQWPCEQLLRQQRSTLDQLPSVRVADEITTPGLLGISGIYMDRLKTGVKILTTWPPGHIWFSARFEDVTLLITYDNLQGEMEPESPLYRKAYCNVLAYFRIDSVRISKMAKLSMRDL